MLSRESATKARERHKRWSDANREHVRERHRVWRAANRASELAGEHRRKGLPLPTRPAPAVCELCGQAPGIRALGLDHCHESGEFRGWLCGRCNVALGMIGDNRETLAAWIPKALRYLKAEAT